MRFELFLALPLAVWGWDSSWLQTGFCNYTLGDPGHPDLLSCINPESIGWAEFSWPPLFPSRVKFVYAADEINGTEWAEVDETHKTNASDVQNTTSSLVSFWLEYDEVSLNNTNMMMETEIAIFYTNTSTEVGGSHNGCEKVLGEECIQKINSTLMSYYLDTSGTDHLPLYRLSNLTDICPEILVSEKQAIGHRDPYIQDYYASSNMRLLALERDPNLTATTANDETLIMPTGNWSYTYSRQVHARRPLANQKNSIAVAVLMRHPRLGLEQSDVHITTVCAKLDSNASYSGGDNDDGRFYSTGGAYKASFVNVPLVFTIIGLSLGFTVGAKLW